MSLSKLRVLRRKVYRDNTESFILGAAVRVDLYQRLDPVVIHNHSHLRRCSCKPVKVNMVMNGVINRNHSWGVHLCLLVAWVRYLFTLAISVSGAVFVYYLLWADWSIMKGSSVASPSHFRLCITECLRQDGPPRWSKNFGPVKALCSLKTFVNILGYWLLFPHAAFRSWEPSYEWCYNDKRLRVNLFGPHSNMNFSQRRDLRDL